MDRGGLRSGCGRIAVLLALASLAAGAASATAHQLLDRVVARVGTHVVTWTDVQAALGLGLVEVGPGEDPERAAVERLIDRQLMLAEVTRFRLPEPDRASIEIQAQAMRRHAGADLDRLVQTTGLDDRRIEALARDSLRIQTYLDQRFGLAVQVSDEDVRRYYDANRHEFVRDGAIAPFEQVEGLARQRAAAERRNALIGRWLADLRARADITVR